MHKPARSPAATAVLAGARLRARASMLLLVAVVALLHAVWPATSHAVYLAPWMGTIDLSNAAANYALDQLYDNKFPASSNLRIRTGAVAGAENADAGTVLATIVTPGSPWAAAASGSKAKQNTWSDSSADATGTAAHYRITGTDTTMIEEGSVTATGGGGDMTLDSTSVTAAQVVTVSTFTRTLA